MNRAPMMIIGSVKIGQSKSIERYVSRLCGLSGTSLIEEAQIDCIAENIRVSARYLAIYTSPMP